MTTVPTTCTAMVVSSRYEGMRCHGVQMTLLGHGGHDDLTQVCGFWRQHMGHPGRVSGRWGQNRSEVRCIHGFKRTDLVMLRKSQLRHGTGFKSVLSSVGKRVFLFF